VEAVRPRERDPSETQSVAMLEFLDKNKEWIFSGASLTVLSLDPLTVKCRKDGNGLLAAVLAFLVRRRTSFESGVPLKAFRCAVARDAHLPGVPCPKEARILQPLQSDPLRPQVLL
jgi:hypothetical protein